MNTVIGIGVAMLVAAMPALAADSSFDFNGHWRVAGVAVPDEGVQALADNDPSYMGRRLTLTPQKLGWDQSAETNQTETIDMCVDPTFTPLHTRLPAELRPQLRKLGMPHSVAYAVHCRSGSWGPDAPATVYLDVAGAIAMPWYDGGVLKLVR